MPTVSLSLTCMYFCSQDDLPSGGRTQPFYSVVNAHDEGPRYIAQCQIKAVPVPVKASTKRVRTILRQLVPLLNHRTVGKCFQTVRIEPHIEDTTETGGDGGKGTAWKKGGEVRLVMNAWMREAWPHG